MFHTAHSNCQTIYAKSNQHDTPTNTSRNPLPIPASRPPLCNYQASYHRPVPTSVCTPTSDPPINQHPPQTCQWEAFNPFFTDMLKNKLQYNNNVYRFTPDKFISTRNGSIVAFFCFFCVAWNFLFRCEEQKVDYQWCSVTASLLHWFTFRV